MSVELGSGEFRYRLESGWGRLPEGWVLPDVAAVAVDADDRVYIFNRGEHPMIVLDRDGTFLHAWGEGVFGRPHGLHIGPDQTLWCTDDGDHTVRQCTPEGKVLLTLGVPGKPAPILAGEPFHRCTHTALSPQGDIYVSDGYGNARVHKFAPDGRLLFSWGEFGTDPGQFNVPHNICCDDDGWVYVADRENHRVQVFDGNGRFETQWHNMHRPCAMCLAMGRNPLCYIGEVGPELAINAGFPNLGPRISILTCAGEVLARLGPPTRGYEDGTFLAPHGLAVDQHGDIYVGEVSHAAWPRFYQGPAPRGLRTLSKMVRLS